MAKWGIILLLVIGGYIFYATSEVNYQAPPLAEEAEEDESITLLFVGDIMLDRGVRNALNRESFDYAFGGVRDLLASADVLVGNLEGVFTDNPSVSLQDNRKLQFTFDPGLVEMLKEFRFAGVSLANNHSLDFGSTGIEQTKNLLDQYDIFHFGSANNDSNLSKRMAVSENEVCFVGYHQLFVSSISSIINEPNALVGACDYIVVFAHWGEEYQDLENEEQRSIGHAFIDAGADLIIGSHPHVVQPVEVYKNKAIFYSLGNFLFDQDFSLATRQGLAVRLTLSEDVQNFHLIPIEMSRARLYYPEKESYQTRMNILISKLPEPYRTEADIDSTFSLPRR